MNYGDSSIQLPSQPPASETACKLDSKARLVLPWKIRQLISVSYGDRVSIKIVGKNNGGLLLEVCNAEGTPAEGANGVKFVKTSKNAWEKLE